MALCICDIKKVVHGEILKKSVPKRTSNCVTGGKEREGKKDSVKKIGAKRWNIDGESEPQTNKGELELCPYPWIWELREPTKLVLLTLHLYAFTQATLC